MADIPEFRRVAEFAQIHDMTGELSEPNKNEIRLYKSSPNAWTFQIRTRKGIVGWLGRGKERDMIASVTIDMDDLKKIRAYMEATR